nr:hypothetical protein [Tanacetum cinerariifolium]
SEAIHLILTGIGDDIYSIVDACTTTKEIWIAIKRLQQDESLNKQDYQNKVNETHAKKRAINANLLALVAAAQHYPDDHYQAPKSHKTHAPSSRLTSSFRSHAPTRNKGKEIAKLVTPPYESTSDEDNDPEQAQKDKEMNLVLNKKKFGQFKNQRTMTVARARERRVQKTKNGKRLAYHKEKMILCKQEKKGVPLRVEYDDWIDDIDKESDEQELEAHNMYMVKIHEVLIVESGPTFDVEPLEKVQYNDDYNVFANERQHYEQLESINDTYVMEKVDSNVIFDSSNTYDNDSKDGQNVKEYEDDHVVLANLIANIKLNTDENKKIQKQFQKANASLTHELKECKSALTESNDVWDRCRSALHHREIELE